MQITEIILSYKYQFLFYCFFFPLTQRASCKKCYCVFWMLFPISLFPEGMFWAISHTGWLGIWFVEAWSRWKRSQVVPVPVLFAAAKLQYGNERAVFNFFNVALYCGVTALSHNIREHGEMENLDNRTLSSLPLGRRSLGLPGFCLPGSGLVSCFLAEMVEDNCQQHGTVCSTWQVFPLGWNTLLQGAGGQTCVLCCAAFAAAWVLFPIITVCAGKWKEGHQTCWMLFCFVFLINSYFLICFHFVHKRFLIYSRPRLKNVDRSTAQQLAVTVGNVTVIITDFKEKTRSSSTSSSTVTSSAGSEQQNQSSSGSESTDKGSSRSSTPKGDMSAVNDESFWKLHMELWKLWIRVWNSNTPPAHAAHILESLFCAWTHFLGHRPLTDATRIISACRGHLATKEFLTLMITLDTFMYSIVLYDFPNNHL